MAEKKEKAAAAPKKETAKKAATKAPRAKKAEKAELVINAENVGFKAGNVYQALAAAEGAALSVKEIAKKAKISEEEAYLGIGWLFKEGKLQGDGAKVTLA